MNLTLTAPEITQPDRRVDPTFHLMSMDTASSRDSLFFIGFICTHGLRIADAVAKAFEWDLSALLEWKKGKLAEGVDVDLSLLEWNKKPYA